MNKENLAAYLIKAVDHGAKQFGVTHTLSADEVFSFYSKNIIARTETEMRRQAHYIAEKDGLVVVALSKVVWSPFTWAPSVGQLWGWAIPLIELEESDRD